MSNTLVVKHLPHEFSEAEKTDFLRHFGARDVKILSSQRKKYSLSFATFADRSAAEAALKKLHQLEVSGVKLCVEYAKDRLPDPQRKSAIKTDNVDNDGTKKSHLNDFIKALNAFNSSVNFMQPPPPHLKYKYPAPNKATLSNIMHALATNTKFYTQVCHLMNRMSLPPPFSTVPDYVVEQSIFHQVPLTTLPPPLPQYQPPVPVEENQMRQETTTEESEIESDPDEQRLKTNLIVNPAEKKAKRKLPLKRPNITKMQQQDHAPKSKQQKLDTQDVFDRVDITNKKIELKVASDVPLEDRKLPPQEENVEIGGFGKILPVRTEPVAASKNEDRAKPTKDTSETDYISSKQLAENRLSSSNYSSLPAFKNYNPGVPSCRLYIKNLSKTVTLEDLNFIYRRYLIPDYKSTEETLMIYDVKLMQEGRMKGQAFITLQNENQAKLALRETNGYILKDKPMVVAFARSAVAK